MNWLQDVYPLHAKLKPIWAKMEVEHGMNGCSAEWDRLHGETKVILAEIDRKQAIIKEEEARRPVVIVVRQGSVPRLSTIVKYSVARNVSGLLDFMGL